jgi:hypothetical protein
MTLGKLRRKKVGFMIGFIIAIILFNTLSFKTNKRLTSKQIAHLWVFTVAFQVTFDNYIDIKYHGYWYFTKDVDWVDFFTITVLVPPVNLMFLNWYPFGNFLWKQIRYFAFWEVILLGYELITLLPYPWGYFHYGWWNLWISAVINPILLLILLRYYKRFIWEPH